MSEREETLFMYWSN